MNIPTPANQGHCDLRPTSRPARWGTGLWTPLRLLAAFVSGTTTVLLLEALKQALFPAITIWQSHLLTAVTVGFCGALAVTANSRRQLHLLMQARADADRCERAEQQARLLFRSIPHPVYLFDAETFALLEVNEMTVASFGYRREDLQGMKATDLVRNRDVDRFVETVRGATAVRSATSFTHRTKDGRTIDMDLTLRSIGYDGHDAVLAIAQDVSERTRLARRHERDRAVTHALSESPTLDALTAGLLKAVGEGFHADVAVLWEIDRQTHTLHCLSLEHVPGIVARQFEEAVRSSDIALGLGLAGDVWVRKMPLWIRDIQAYAEWPFLECATSAGLRGAFAFPVIPPKGNPCVMEFLSRDIAEPSEDFLEGLSALGLRLGHFVERRRAEAENVRLAAAVAQAADAVVITNRAGRIEYVNPAAARMTGYSVDELIGRTPSLLKSEQQDAGFYAELWRTILRGDVWQGQLVNRRKDGRLYTEAMTITPVRDPSGAITHFVAVKMDVSSRVEAEHERAFLASIVEHSNDPILAQTTDGTIASWNRAAERLFGYTAGEVIGRPFAMLMAADVAERVRHERDRLIAGDDVPVFEAVVRTHDGRAVDAQIRLSPIRNGDGAITAVAAVIHDISARTRVAEALRRSEDKYRSLLANMPDVVWTVDASANVLFISPTIEHLSGFTADECYARGAQIFVESIHPDDAERVRRARSALFTSGHPYAVECRVRRKNGEWMWISDRAFRTYEQDGIRCADGILVDITARKEYEEELFQSRQALRSILNAIPQRVFWKDRSLVYLGCNQAFADDAGLGSPDDVIGRTDFELSWRDTAELYRADDANVIRLEQSKLNFDEPQDTPDGTVLWLRTNKLPLRDRDGSVVAVIGTYEDITERKRAEQSLRRAEEMYRSLVSNIPDVTWTVDNHGHTVFLSPNIATVLGVPLDVAVACAGHAVFDRVHPDDLAATTTALNGLFEKGQAYDVEYRVRRPDGEWIWVHDRAVATYDKDGMRYADGVLSDITERKRLALELQQAQKLTAIGQLAAGIAHEINTPIQFIGDNVTFLRDAFRDVAALVSSYQDLGRAAVGLVDAGVLDAAVRAEEAADWAYLETEVPTSLAHTLEGVDRVAKIVRAMKDFSHTDMDGGSWKASDMNRALESTLIVAHNELKYVADVETDFGDVPPVICNLSALNQVFLNLLINAAHAVGEVTRITGTKGRICVRTWRDAGDVVVAIADTGTGIPDAIRERVFEPFFTTKEVGRGTGQGLALARSTVTRHAGSITFDTERGKGTTFYVRVPIDGPTPTAAF